MEFYSICNSGKHHNTLMQCNIFLLRCSNLAVRLARAANPSPTPHPIDVMFPLLLNKAVSTLWPDRPRPSAWPGRRHHGRPRKRINLALQGGGAHGAFTWGVLDQLLSDDRLAIEGISGTSAGALNAVVLADGLTRGGSDEAQKRLAEFWRAASSSGSLPVLQRAVMGRLLSFTPLEGTPVQAWFDALSRYFSPYDVNPLNINPLKDLFERFVDFEALRANTDLQIFISATNVQPGHVRIFGREKITAAEVMGCALL